MYISKLADIFNESSNTYHTTVIIMPADVQSSKYIENSC